MAMTYLGGFYAIGSHIETGGRDKRYAKRWMTGGSARFAEGYSVCIKYSGDTLVRVDSIHAWGSALIASVRMGMDWMWPPASNIPTPPSLFIEPGRILEQHMMLLVTLTMADIGAETLPRISDGEFTPLEPESHFDTGDNDNG